MNEILPAAEKALSDAWGGAVRLSLSGLLQGRKHVARLHVLEAPAGAPGTAILKRPREEGDERFDPDASADEFLNDWAG